MNFHAALNRNGLCALSLMAMSAGIRESRATLPSIRRMGDFACWIGINGFGIVGNVKYILSLFNDRGRGGALCGI